MALVSRMARQSLIITAPTEWRRIIPAELGCRHGLEVISVIDVQGRMNDAAPRIYQSMTVNECRTRIVEDLHDLGVLEAEEPYENKVSQCYRCKTTIEPFVSEQSSGFFYPA